MAFWFNRYENYTTRGEVYLFTLKDYCEFMMIKQFGGSYIVRKGMALEDGYLMEFPADQVSRISAFVIGEGSAEGGSVNDQKSYVTSSKIFQTIPIQTTAEGNGEATIFQISSLPLVPSAEKFSAVKTDADGTVTPAVVTVSGTTATLKISDATVATANLTTGTVTFSAAPAEGVGWEFFAEQIAFTLNYQLLGNVLYAGLSSIPDPAEATVSDVDLEADGENTVFQAHANLKPSTVNLTLTPTGDGAEAIEDIEDDGNGNLKKSTTVYGTVDYVSGLIQLENAPASLSYSATYFMM